jgi:hypothetical protein
MSDTPWYDRVDASEPSHGGETITSLQASRLKEVCDGNDDYCNRLGNPVTEEDWKQAVAKVKINDGGKLSDIQKDYEEQLRIQ